MKGFYISHYTQRFMYADLGFDFLCNLGPSLLHLNETSGANQTTRVILNVLNSVDTKMSFSLNIILYVDSHLR